MARLRALLHRYLSPTARLGAVLALSGAVLAPAFALPAAASTGRGKVYVVKSGDTLWEIAVGQGLGSWRAIFDANAIVKDPDLIFPGQRLVIPGRGAALRSRSASWSHHRTARSHTSGSRYASAPRSAPVAGGSVWDRLAQCESGGNWSINTGNGFYGGLQFTLGSWRASGGSGMPQNASRSTQIWVAQRLQQMQGWGAWPTCSAKIGLR